MFDGLVHAAQEFVRQYGLLAVFVFTFLEASLLFPFLPSEVVLPFAASVLIRKPADVVPFVAAATAGVTVGSVVAYFVFGRGGEEVAERFGPLVGISDRELRWSQGWFRRRGETAVLWARLFPVVRSAISVPAGFARMDLKRFVVYSTVGGVLFNTAIAAAALYGEDGAYEFVVGRARTLLVERPLVAAVAVIATVIVAVVAYRRRASHR